MKSFRKVYNGHTYHVTCSYRVYWATVTLHEDGVAVVRKRHPVGSIWDREDSYQDISFEGVTAIVKFDSHLLAKSCEWSLADCSA